MFAFSGRKGSKKKGAFTKTLVVRFKDFTRFNIQNERNLSLSKQVISPFFLSVDASTQVKRGKLFWLVIVVNANFILNGLYYYS